MIFQHLIIFHTFAFGFNSQNITVEQDHNAPVVTVSIVTEGGYRTDPTNQEGLHNFMGEMLLRGTKKLNRDQFQKALEKMGATAAFKVTSEASTLTATVLKRNLSSLIELLSTAVSEPSFQEIEIKLLKNQLISGLKQMETSVQFQGGRWFKKIMFGSHYYSKSDVGTAKGISYITRSSLIKNHHETFIARPLKLLFLGDISQEEANRFGSKFTLTEKNKKSPPSYLRPEVFSSKKLFTKLSNSKITLSIDSISVIDMPFAKQSNVFIGTEGYDIHSLDYTQLEIANDVIGGGGFQSRLFDEIRIKNGWTYGIASGFRYAKNPHSWSVSYMPKTDDTGVSLKRTLEVISNFADSGVSRDELNSFKKIAINNFPFLFNTAEKRLNNILMQQQLDLRKDFFTSQIDQVNSVSFIKLNETIKKFFSQRPYKIIIVGNASQVIPQIIESLGLKENQISRYHYDQ